MTGVAQTPATLIRLRPAGPWRIGPASGARDQVDRVFHSDTLFSALCSAMQLLGKLEEWLADTAANPEGSAVRLSSLFPYLGGTLFVPPPDSHWPPAASPKVRWKGAAFIPVELGREILRGTPPDESRWVVDPISECLLALEKGISEGPFRLGLRSGAAVDRLAEGRSEPFRMAALEFAENAGMWGLAGFKDDAARDRWRPVVETAFRWLADSGLGGERTRGWGRATSVDFEEIQIPHFFLPPAAAAAEPAEGQEAVPPSAANWWVLGLFSPAASDRIDWKRGCYRLVPRGGRVESPAGWGAEKKVVKMVAEGSVLEMDGLPAGTAPDVAPNGFAHPVYRAGFGLAVPIPRRVNS